MARKKGGMSAGSLIGGILVVLTAMVLIVNLGLWKPMSQIFGLPEINDLSQLMPGEDSKVKPDVKLGLKEPSSKPSDPNTRTNTPEATETPSESTQTPNGDNSSSQEQTASTGVPEGALSPITTQQALDRLSNIETAVPHTKGYDRKKDFGTWQNSGQLCGYGTTRDYILKRDMSDVTMDKNCKVLTGTLQDPYTGKTIRFQRDTYETVNGKQRKTGGDSMAVQIDHVVAVNDAWASGLWKDSRKGDRIDYANDPEVLVASEGEANNVKQQGVNLVRDEALNGSKTKWQNGTPSVWLPSNKTYQCSYMAKRVYIKDKYKLSMSGWEKAETKSFLTQCVADGS